MPKEPQPDPQRDMTDEEITDVFRTLHLPTSAPPASIPQQPGPVVFYPITGDSLPLQTR